MKFYENYFTLFIYVPCILYLRSGTWASGRIRSDVGDLYDEERKIGVETVESLLLCFDDWKYTKCWVG